VGTYPQQGFAGYGAAEDNISREAAADGISREDTNSKAKEDTSSSSSMVISSNSRAKEEASTADNHLVGSPPTQLNDTAITGTVGPMDAASTTMDSTVTTLPKATSLGQRETIQWVAE
jgi:hypothetical protein